jgi:hypothetical protein
MTRLWAEGVPITVTTDRQGQPQLFYWQGRSHPIRTIIAERRVDVHWWQNDRVWRHYYTLTSQTGLMVTIFRDLLADGWYLQQLYD